MDREIISEDSGDQESRGIHQYQIIEDREITTEDSGDLESRGIRQDQIIEEPAEHNIEITKGTPEIKYIESQHRVMQLMHRIWPWVAIVGVQILNSGLSIIIKMALSEGMNHFVFAIYRNIVATVTLVPIMLVVERNFIHLTSMKNILQLVTLATLEPVMDQVFLYTGLSRINASLSSAISVTLPAVTFLLAVILRLERVRFKRWTSQAKVMGVLVTLVGAVIKALYKGIPISLPWTRKNQKHLQFQVNSVEGVVYSGAAVLSAALYNILLAKTVASYPAPLIISTSMSAVAALLNFGVAKIFGGHIGPDWMIGWNVKLLSYLYAGVMVSGLASYLSSLVIRVKGPVILAASSPLSMIMVMSIGSMALGEQLNLGSLISAACIVIGIALLLWGKFRENDDNLKISRTTQRVE